ncbi:MAG: sigma-54-dependent Fis family transcriptional regulator [Acidobacteria bacterium]|nr:sigma-54-dependent Fis family transcriptional regulator [Acidobacteriota bacterium]MBS1864958.1 sigma-54-dependent Fis family transcriptional regulator [Acidobacteriota bacterium]
MASTQTSQSLAAKVQMNVLPDDTLFGIAPTMFGVRSKAEKICRTNVPVLLCGEGGTGKEALARWIHSKSEFAMGEFVKVNCAAIPSALLESELFGYEKGAFTGANLVKPGRVEKAHQGTLFLDEIADLDWNLQSKLLHFLQDGTFSRIGDQGERRVECRLICSTNKDMEKETAEGRFRQDLLYRIQVFRLTMPPLRERKEDIPSLAEHFRQQFEKQFELKSFAFPPEMLVYLKSLPWLGNIRELSNGIARYVLLGPEASLHQENTGRRDRASEGEAERAKRLPLKRIAKDVIHEMEKKVILESLRANQWNRRKTAQELKISYRALIYKIRDAGLVSRRAALQQQGREIRPSE